MVIRQNTGAWYLDKLWVSQCWSNENHAIVQVCKAVGYWSLQSKYIKQII